MWLTICYVLFVLYYSSYISNKSKGQTIIKLNLREIKTRHTQNYRTTKETK